MKLLYPLTVMAFLMPIHAEAGQKDKATVEFQDGSKAEVKVPHDLKVEQLGPNHYQIHRSDPALKHIEIKVIPPNQVAK